MALEGKTCRLREIKEEDLQFLVDLRNDLDTQGFTKSLPTDYTLPMYRKQQEERTFSYHRDDGRFIIEEKESGKTAGMISYYSLDPRIGGVIGIAMDKAFWSTGMAYDAQETLMQFMFEELGLRVVRLYTNSGNPAAVKLAEKSGFKVAVRNRESVWRKGNLYDNLVMDILREEYYELHPELTDNLPKL